MSTLALPKRKPKDKSGKIGLLGHLKILLVKLPASHIGGLAAIGAYFFFTQLLHGQHTTVGSREVTFPDVKYFWDHLLDTSLRQGGLVAWLSAHDWTTWRHLVRPLYEGIFGGLLFLFASINPVKVDKKLHRNASGTITPSRVAKAEIRFRFIPTFYRKVTPLQIVALPLTITLYSIPGCLAGFGVDRLLRLILHAKSLAPALSSHPSVLDKFYSGAFDAKIIGLFGAAFFASRPAKVVYTHVLNHYAQRRAWAGKKTHWWHLPGYRLAVRYYAGGALVTSATPVDTRSRASRLAISGSTVFVLGMAGLGYYVLRFVAGG